MATAYVNDYGSTAPWNDAINAAIMAAGVGGTVVFGAGQYIINQSIYPLEGQTIVGAGRTNTTIRLDFSNILALPTGGAMIIGTYSSPNVIVDGITFNGGRSDCGLPDYQSDPILCPSGVGGGVAARVGWVVKNCRFTNINGFKVSVFGAHDAIIESNVFDCDAPGTSGDPDNIGGGAGAVGVVLRNNHITSTAKGSGIDITNAYDCTIEGNLIEFRSLIVEGVTNVKIRGNTVAGSGTGSDRGNINIKSNGRYLSSIQNGVFMPRNTIVEDNTVIGADGAPGIVISYADARIGEAASLSTGGGNRIIGNRVVNSKGLGVVIFGDYRSKSEPDVIMGNFIDTTRDTTWGSGIGTFKNAGIGLGVGNRDLIAYNYITNTINGISVYTSGTQSVGSGRVTKTVIFDNSFGALSGYQLTMS